MVSRHKGLKDARTNSDFARRRLKPLDMCMFLSACDFFCNADLKTLKIVPSRTQHVWRVERALPAAGCALRHFSKPSQVPPQPTNSFIRRKIASRLSAWSGAGSCVQPAQSLTLCGDLGWWRAATQLSDSGSSTQHF
jgi:hypothetical protein